MIPYFICIPLGLVLVIAVVGAFIEWTTGGAVSQTIKNIFALAVGENITQNVTVNAAPADPSTFPTATALEIATLLAIVVQWMGYLCTFCLPNYVVLCIGFPLALATSIPGLIVGRRLQNGRLVRRSIVAGISPFVFLVAFVIYAIVLRSSTQDEMMGYRLLQWLFPQEFGNLPPPVP